LDIDSPTTHTPSIHQKKVLWSTDLGVSTLSEELFPHFSEQKLITEESGELDDFPECKKPQARFDSSHKIIQKIRFSLIRHKGTVSDITILHLSVPNKFIPLMTTKIHQFFKSYHQKQLFSLSGYFHVSSALSSDELFQLPLIDEWLELYHYYIKICPSQAEEMVKIRLLL
jgi:hypothetical protein